MRYIARAVIGACAAIGVFSLLAALYNAIVAHSGMNALSALGLIVILLSTMSGVAILLILGNSE